MADDKASEYVLIEAPRERVHRGAALVCATVALLAAASLVVTHSSKWPPLTRPAMVVASFRQPPMTGAVSLNYVRKGPPPAFQGMSIGLEIEGVTDRPQQCLVDLGSSTAAFCDTRIPRLLKQSALHMKTNQAQCNMYGSYAGNSPDEPAPGSDCPSAINTSMMYEWFYGSVYHGNLLADNAPYLPLWQLQGVEYTVMDRQSQMTCELGFDGIFGVAFDLLNSAKLVPDGDASRLLTTCSSSWGDTYPLGQCSGDYEVVVDRSPIMRALAASGQHRFGFYADIAELSGLTDLAKAEGSSDATKGNNATIVYERGMLFIGEAATTTELYHRGPRQTVLTWERLHGETERYWSFQMEGFELLNKRQGAAPMTTWSLPYQCPSYGNCIVDSGNPSLQLPAPAVKHLQSLGDKLASFDLLLHLVDHVTLRLPGAFLMRQLALGYLQQGAGVVLGLPVSELFYIVFDDEADSITFVSMQ